MWSREEKKVLKKLKEREKKSAKYKITKIIVKEAKKREAGTVLEKLGKNVANNMIK